MPVLLTYSVALTARRASPLQRPVYNLSNQLNRPKASPIGIYQVNFAKTFVSQYLLLIFNWYSHGFGKGFLSLSPVSVIQLQSR
jgi:hypothetical protein